jgi:hypothetical protein
MMLLWNNLVALKVKILKKRTWGCLPVLYSRNALQNGFFFILFFFSFRFSKLNFIADNRKKRTPKAPRGREEETGNVSKWPLEKNSLPNI